MSSNNKDEEAKRKKDEDAEEDENEEPVEVFENELSSSSGSSSSDSDEERDQFDESDTDGSSKQQRRMSKGMSSGDINFGNGGKDEGLRKRRGGRKKVCERKQAEEKAAPFEAKAIKVGRQGFLLVILFTGMAICGATFTIFYLEEKSLFKSVYSSWAEKISEAVELQAINFQLASQNLAEEITAAAEYLAHQQQRIQYTKGSEHVMMTGDADANWPFVTIPNTFETMALHARRRSPMELILLTPLVSDAQRKDYEEYTIQQAGTWINASRALYELEITHEGHDEENHRRRRRLQHRRQSSMKTRTAATTTKTQTMRRRHRRRYLSENYNHSTTEEGIVPFLWEETMESPDGEQHNDHDDHGHNENHNEWIVPAQSGGPYLPIWQTSPPPPPFGGPDSHASIINYDLLSTTFEFNIITAIAQRKVALLTPVLYATTAGPLSHMATSIHDSHHTVTTEGEFDMITDEDLIRPHTTLVEPIFSKFRDSESDIVAFVQSILIWDRFIAGVMPPDQTGIQVVLKNSCGQSYTYQHWSVGDETDHNNNDDDDDGEDKAVDAEHRTHFMGAGDLHDPYYNDYEQVVNVGDFGDEEWMNGDTTKVGYCLYRLAMYPSDASWKAQQTRLPLILTSSIAGAFVTILLTFLIYDNYVQHRNNKVLKTAAKATQILTSLFPTAIFDRMLAEKTAAEKGGKGGDNHHSEDTGPDPSPAQRKLVRSSKAQLSKFLQDGEIVVDHGSGGTVGGGGAKRRDSDDDDFMLQTKPIAELFPETTIMFGDIAGFTAWSSQREPCQVFVLLETLYQAFDEIARRRRVFKVETVGDCYVAVTGLPEPRKDHAVAMSRFARDCMAKMNELTKKLEKVLGPDTSDLSMRVGLHSGPVTAGVLRGERSRFQLFGDTMNTASRMETTGIRDHIQISQDTADLLTAAGKQHWFRKREDKVVAKGKGEMQTYFLVGGKEDTPKKKTDSTEATEEASGTSSSTKEEIALKTKAKASDAARISRLIDWNHEVLAKLLKQVIARREVTSAQSPEEPIVNFTPYATDFHSPDATVIDEVKEIITLPAFEAGGVQSDADDVKLDETVENQLHDFVTVLASLYHENPFHNFEHASHVTMSVVKLLSRIVAPDVQAVDGEIDSLLHDHTYGITSDPLTQFACVLSALIHDIDHPGVPNVTMVAEKSPIAILYKNKSAAEQNSIDLAWDLLMQDEYAELRKAIYLTESEMKRFRQLLVNSVMATDIMDPDLKKLRNARWDKAFHQKDENIILDEHTLRDNINRKATIVIEHLIQASDVAHTMQHWHVYIKWNEMFFRECYEAYEAGRAEKDPCESWYRGEIGFYDFYIIPLAKKLKECGVFGVSSDEYLNYATRNRKEWEERGQEIVNEFIAKHCNKKVKK